MEKPIFIRSHADIEIEMAKIRESARKAHLWIAAQPQAPMAFLKSVKFEKNGYHPISGHSLNLIEQVNQTWTFAVALVATRLLLEWHPEAGGFRLAPGSTMSQPLDIMSEEANLVGAETFAATKPSGNNKLNKDLAKFAIDTMTSERYIFFASPGYPHRTRHTQLEKHGVQVWSVELPGD